MPKDSEQVLTWKIAGIAGGGQQVAGLIFAKACARGGLYTFDSSEYPSLIRGEFVTYRLSISTSPVSAIYQPNQLLIALTKEAYEYCLSDVVPGGAILYDSDKFKVEAKNVRGRKVFPLPLKTLSESAGVKPIAANILAIGATTALLKYDPDIVKRTLQEVFSAKGQEVVAMNLKAFDFGYHYAQKEFDPAAFPFTLTPAKKRGSQILVTANDTVALGAVAAGCQFFVAYPMTPSSSILHNMMNWADETGMLVFQPEDEIAGIHMAIGGMFAGVRTMTATSGGGFALMNEALSLTAVTENPLVLVESQRPGPATGLPTWTEQGDLAYVSRAGHGEFPRVILAPGDASEAFPLTGLAFNLAEKYQIPVILLLDKYISEAHESIAPITQKFTVDRGARLTDAQLTKIKEYKRYLHTTSGISPRAVPGQLNGIFLANSDEHDERGYTIEGFQGPERVRQVDKRFRKVSRIHAELPKPMLIGPKKAALTFIGWGSTKGPMLEALKELKNVNYLHVSAPWPISEKVMKTAVSGARKLVAIENNATGQFAELLRGATGIKVDDVFLKYDGAHFFPHEIIAKAKKLG
ncbi:MAG: 2-oxoacid:acceptor oxidoreductase subunit alpha [bacterium]|nr:2-oxoacid:acceptor oxidoreductase subunit alpha [bacterium]